MNEIWKDIKGYEGLYQISNLGKVRSLSRKVQYNVFDKTTSYRYTKKMILKPRLDNLGYVAVMLSKENTVKQYRIHRLVANAFLERIKGKDMINHINGIKNDNRVENLEWCTSKENSIHAYQVLYPNRNNYNSIKCILIQNNKRKEFGSIQ